MVYRMFGRSKLLTNCAAERNSKRSMMSAAAVAEAGVTGLLAGRAEVVPGWLNKLAAWGTALGPRWVASWVAERAMGGKGMRQPTLNRDSSRE